jgi:WD40 repeat protein
MNWLARNARAIVVAMMSFGLCSLGLRSTGMPSAEAEYPGDKPGAQAAKSRLPSQRLLHDERALAGSLLSAAWSPSGDQIITGHGDGEVRLWDVATGNLLWHRLLAPVLSPRGEIACPFFVMFSHDGKQFIVGGKRDDDLVNYPGPKYHPGIVTVYGSNRDVVKSEVYARAIQYAALSSDSKLLVVAPPDPAGGPSPNAAELRGIDLTTGQTLWTGLPGERHPGLFRLAQRDVRAMCFQPGSTALDVALCTGEVVRLDALTGRELRRFLTDWRSPEVRQSSRPGWPQMGPAVFSGDDRTLASIGDQSVYLWDVNSGKLRLSIRYPHGGCYLALSAVGKMLAISDIPGNGPANWGSNTICLYATETGEQVMTLEPANRATVLAFSPNGAKLFTGFHQGSGLVWDMRAPVKAERLSR